MSDNTMPRPDIEGVKVTYREALNTEGIADEVYRSLLDIPCLLAYIEALEGELEAAKSGSAYQIGAAMMNLLTEAEAGTEQEREVTYDPFGQSYPAHPDQKPREYFADEEAQERTGVDNVPHVTSD